MEPRERLPGVSRFPASAAGLPADGSNSVWFPPAATFYKFAAEVNLTFLPKARRMWYDRKNVKMRRIKIRPDGGGAHGGVHRIY